MNTNHCLMILISMWLDEKFLFIALKKFTQIFMQLLDNRAE
jgi:hypothetical protein